MKRRDVAEQVYRAAPDDYWAEGDRREARILYLMGAIGQLMGEPHSAEYIDRYLGGVPEHYRAVLRKVPRFICISPRGGREAEHVLAILATAEQWEANFNLKDHVVQATRVSRDYAREICDLLASTGSESLADLLRMERV